MNKWLYVLGIIVLAGFAALTVWELMSQSTPYVMKVADLKSMSDRPVQFMGAVDHQTAEYDEANDELRFQIKDEDGESVKVRFKGVKPANFDTAPKAVVTGIYRSGEINATKVALSCPSKYENK